MKIKNKKLGFVDFIRKQDVMTFGMAFILGGAVSNLVGSFTKDIINPVTSTLLGKAGGLNSITIGFGQNTLYVGNFIGTLLNFVVIAFIVYLLFKVVGLEKLDLKEEAVETLVKM
jgi:large conductance mechanosensitive channel